MAEQRVLNALVAVASVMESLTLDTDEGDPITATADVLQAWAGPFPEDYKPTNGNSMISWELAAPELRTGGTLREHIYDFHIQLFLENDDFEEGYKIATAYWAKLMLAFDRSLTLGGTISHHELISGKAARLTFNNTPYPGLDCHLLVYLKDTPAGGFLA